MKPEEYVPYFNDDLGATYHPEYTEFVLWAPASSEVTLNLESEEEKVFIKYPMNKEENGVFRLTVNGDFLNRKYYYTVINNGIEVDTNDPWGKGASLNSQYSAVVDIEAVKKLKNIAPKTQINSYLDAIIYELHIRDFTEDKHTNIEDRRHYLGLVEPHRKTNGGHPAGLDYLKFLGITHVQIQPVFDFYGADDVNPLRGYNWGYNPISYFALEGSFSKAPEIPQSRLMEFKTMVNELHKNDIRVVIDVVYNHVYEYKNTSWQKLVPDYFFRFLPNGRISESSGCGNDFASEKPMARKMIIDSIKYLFEVFDIDGLRFDLMGINDYETINMAYEEVKKIKPDAIFYGEGWNMPTALDEKLRASADNASKMPNIAFFNDTFRDIIKGHTFDLNEKGFICGNLDNLSMVEYVMKASVVNSPYKRRFDYPHQSINYVECHDNHTLFDKLVFSNCEEEDDMLLQRINLANAVVMFSFGVPFFHMGQEIGQSKFGLGNSYNVVKVNNMSWKLLDERFDMASYFHLIALLRRNILSFLKVDSAEAIATMFRFKKWGNDLFCVTSDNREELLPYKKIVILYNPTNETKQYELNDYYAYLSISNDKRGTSYIKNGIIPAGSVQILGLLDGEKK